MSSSLDYCDQVDVSLLTGRWVRSDSKYDNWEAYMEWFGMSGEAAREEVIEPQLHIVSAASRDSMTLVHQLPWREGAQAEYTLHFDGKYHPIPEALFKTARSSWVKNERAEWMHKWDEKGLMTEQLLLVKGTDHILRYWRSLVNPNEIMIRVHVYKLLPDGAEEEVIHSVRYFHRIPFKQRWTAAAAQFFSGMDVQDNLKTCISWMRKAKAKGADLLVLPENSNRDRRYFEGGKPSKAMAHDMSETLDGSFVSGLKETCRGLNMWLCVGVDLQGPPPETAYIAQVLIRPDGEIEGVNKKHVLWDYEYTLFTPGEDKYQVFDTELGRLGMMICADGIVPEAARVVSLMGAQVLLNSLNSRGPDEMRVHIPLRALENGVWHVAANAVGNPHDDGLLWPWTGGSQICDPLGQRVVASEEHDDIVFGEVRPFEAESKRCSWTDNIFTQRRPELYGALVSPLGEVPCAKMYGPAPEVLPFEGPESVKVAMMQLSYVHTRKCTEWMTKRQVSYASRRGAVLGVLPELWCFPRGEVARDPKAAAEYSSTMLSLMISSAQESGIHLCFSLVEGDAQRLFHTGYLVGPQGLVAKYRKAHLSAAERAWGATAGDELAKVVSVPTLGRIALMIGDEVWIPEVLRCLAIEGVEIALHPTDWDSAEAGEMAATERAGENRVHLVSVTRIDCPGKLGSQTTLAGEYIGGEPIPLMRYAQGVWARHNLEEQILVDLPRRQAHCKMMGEHLDVLRKRFPRLYGACTKPTGELSTWHNTTKIMPGDYDDECRIVRGELGRKRKYDVAAPLDQSALFCKQGGEVP